VNGILRPFMFSLADGFRFSGNRTYYSDRCDVTFCNDNGSTCVRTRYFLSPN
jgi:hypothetical protein